MTSAQNSPPGPPLGRRIPRPVFKVVNRVMRRILSLPFPTPPGRRLMLVYLTGRKTGRHYRQPVSYVRHDGTLLTPGGGNWKRNLNPGKPALLRVNGRDVTAIAEIVTDPDTIAELYAVMVAGNPVVARMSGLGVSPDRDRIEQALAYGFVIVRWRLQPH